MILSRIRLFYYLFEFVLSVSIMVVLMSLFKKKIHKLRRAWAKTQRVFGFYKIEVIGQAKDVNMIIMNHRSMLDIVVMEEIYPKDLCWVAKKELQKIPIIGKVIDIPKMIPIDRSSSKAIVNLIKNSKKRVSEDRVIAIFPEGTRAYQDELLPFQSGAKVVADKLNLKVQPVVLVGTEALNIKNLTFKGGDIKVIFLDEIDTSEENWLEKAREDMQKAVNKQRNKH